MIKNNLGRQSFNLALTTSSWFFFIKKTSYVLSICLYLLTALSNLGSNGFCAANLSELSQQLQSTVKGLILLLRWSHFFMPNNNLYQFPLGLVSVGSRNLSRSKKEISSNQLLQAYPSLFEPEQLYGPNRLKFEQSKLILLSETLTDSGNFGLVPNSSYIYKVHSTYFIC